jgi:hypothetical protein
MADEYTAEQAMKDAEEAVNGPGGWRDLLAVESVLRKRAEEDLKKARQEIARLMETAK